jgi:hypothetical protein
MVVVEGRRLLWRDRLVFFPNQEELDRLAARIPAGGVLRVRQTTATPPGGARILWRREFRTACVRLDPGVDEILASMGKRTRGYVRSTERLGDRVSVRRNGDAVARDFVGLQRGFARQKGYTAVSTLRRIRDYQPCSDVTVLYLDGEPMCGRLALRDPSIGRVRLVASTRRFQDSGSDKVTGPLNKYLHYWEFRTYKEEGFDAYDVGGIGDGTSALARFKLSFAAVPVTETDYVMAGALGALGYRGFIGLENLRKGITRPLARRRASRTAGGAADGGEA